MCYEGFFQSTSTKAVKPVKSAMPVKPVDTVSDRMAEIGRKGGEKVSSNREHMAEIGRKGGEKVSSNREHMDEIGRLGGLKTAEKRRRWLST